MIFIYICLSLLTNQLHIKINSGTCCILYANNLKTLGLNL